MNNVDIAASQTFVMQSSEGRIVNGNFEYSASSNNGFEHDYVDCDIEAREQHSCELLPPPDASIVDKLVFDCRMRRSISLDLSKTELQKLPDEVLSLEQIEYLYLEGNQISSLPEEFFKCFPRLKWLDLRCNCLTSIPSSYLDSHSCLRTLLLEHNELTTLPLELGNVQTLDGLNLRNNNLEFPPREVIDRGTKKILSYLRRLLRTKSGDQSSYTGSQYGSTTVHSNSDMSSEETDMADRRSASRSAASNKSGRKPRLRRRRTTRTASTASVSDLAGDPSVTSATSLQCLPANQSGSSKGGTYLSQSDKYLKPGDDVVSETKIQSKYGEERRLARLRNTKLKQDEIIQGIKNQELVRDFRDETKRLQAKKLAERRMNGFVDFVEPATTAPFGVSSDELKTVTNAERLQLNAKKERKQDKMPRPISPESKLRMEELRLQKEQVLRDKIRQHTIDMHERRKKSNGNPVEDMKAAQHELEMALQLQKEVEMRRKELEYRFTAHTVDAIDSHQAAPRSSSKKYS